LSSFDQLALLAKVNPLAFARGPDEK
jgi:hypothetical protein